MNDYGKDIKKKLADSKTTIILIASIILFIFITVHLYIKKEKAEHHIETLDNLINSDFLNRSQSTDYNKVPKYRRNNLYDVIEEMQKILSDTSISKFELDSIVTAFKVKINYMEAELQDSSLNNIPKKLDNNENVNNRYIQKHENPDIYLEIYLNDEQSLKITKKEMEILLRFFFQGSEKIYTNRFNMITIDVNKDGLLEIFLYDNSLGTTWLLNSELNKFNRIDISDLDLKRRNEDSDEIIDLFIDRTSGYKIGFPDSIKHKNKGR